VRKAVWNLFGAVRLQVKRTQMGSVLVTDVNGLGNLSTLQNALRRNHIRDASRKALHHGLRGKVITFCLNKQAAFADHVSFSEAESESPLGPIVVAIEAEEPLQLIDWLAPRTSNPEG